MLNGKKVIMAVGAHTGDAQLTMGMLLAKHAQMGDHVIIVDLTAGTHELKVYDTTGWCGRFADIIITNDNTTAVILFKVFILVSSFCII